MAKRLVRKVVLALFEDNNGSWGTAHADTIQDTDDGSSFDAFWSGALLFHDVFEHAHEFQHKYFRGESAMNVGGEMAAMGSFLYYNETLHIDGRIDRNFRYRAPSEDAAMTTSGMVREGMSNNGYMQFGYGLQCSVPYQRPVDCYHVEDCIDAWFRDVDKDTPEPNEHDRTEFEFEYPGTGGNLFDVLPPENSGQAYRDTFKRSKVASLHRWGFKHAQRLVPNTSENQNALSEFISFWNDFCKQNEAETLAQYFKRIEFRIYKEAGEISWTATLRGDYGMKDAKITAKTRGFCVEDYMEVDM